MPYHDDMDDGDLVMRAECEALVHRYCTLVDSGNAAAAVDLFTEDAVWTAPGIELRGRDELRHGLRLVNVRPSASPATCAPRST